ncbi:MAG TPA: TetR/AcrR family transcriptional regulator [Streptosporangiaceae bacterium]|nr:TetR/AcrR family transcriptional regulator [Streptosporangiaceae bacterium]
MAGSAAAPQQGEFKATPGRRAGPGRPRDPGVDAAIRAATMDVLAEVGYARLTMDQVAASARVSKSSLYLRWPNKVALVAEALQHRARPVPDVPDTGTLAGDMRVFLRDLLRSRHEASRALAAVSGEITTNPELRQAWHRGLAGMITACTREIVDRAIARGELPAGADAELLADLPLSLLQNWRLHHDGQPGDEVTERIVRQFYTPPRDLPEGARGADT